MAETHVRNLIGEIFRRGGMRRAVRRAEAVLMWPRIAGPDLARFTRARSLTGGVLFVDVPDSETAMHLSLQRSRFLEAYGTRFGSGEVREIRFRAGRRQERGKDDDAPDSRARIDPDPDELVNLTRSLGGMNLPDPLAGPALAAARAMLAHRARARLAGWTPCPHCSALCPEPGPCHACARHRHAPRVVRAAERLTLRPDDRVPELIADELAVARALAAEALDARLDELLPQVLASPALAPQLERAARHRLAVERGVAPQAIDEAEFERLDARVARALGRWRPAAPPEDP